MVSVTTSPQRLRGEAAAPVHGESNLLNNVAGGFGLASVGPEPPFRGGLAQPPHPRVPPCRAARPCLYVKPAGTPGGAPILRALPRALPRARKKSPVYILAAFKFDYRDIDRETCRLPAAQPIAGYPPHPPP